MIYLLGIALLISTALYKLPQTVKLYKTHNTQGLSIATQIAWVPSWLIWAGVAAHDGAWAKAGADTLAAVCDAAILVLLVRANKNKLWDEMKKAWWVPVLLGAVFITGSVWGVVALLAAMTIFDLIGFAPQAKTILASPTCAGVSLTTWVIAIANCGGWILYATALGTPTAAGWAWGMLVVDVALFTVIWSRQKQPTLATT